MSDSTAELAARIARQTVGHVPASVRRFTTGAQHYVFDLCFTERPPVVVRIGDESAHILMAGAVYLSDLLRSRGVPLPALLAHDTHAERPWLVLERLPGADLGDVINDLSDQQCDEIARRVAQAQLVASKLGSAGRYGYAVLPEQAPYTGWTQVLDAHLARSRSRITSAGLFNIGHIESIEAILATLRDQVDAVVPTPFLHDTTTKNVIVTTEGSYPALSMWTSFASATRVTRQH